jgi:type I restriction enzyme S subunit
MMSVLLENAPLVATAPGGTKAIRSLILELAMRGQLTKPESDDIPVDTLWQQVQSSKQRLLLSGQCKRLRAAAAVDVAECPHALPATWRWTRLAEVGHDWGQREPTAPFTYIDVGSLDNHAGEVKEPQVVVPAYASSRARKIVRRGSLIYSTIRPYLLNVAVLDKEFSPVPIASTAFAVIHPYCDMPSRFFFWWLRSPAFTRYVEDVQTGIAYPAINDAQFFSGLVPLPPLAEQHRIVAKVDELMALCDRLEARQQDAEAAHARLVQTLLDSLTQARDAAEFQASWERLEVRLHELLSTDAAFAAFESTVLQLAMRGKLCTQMERDEPAEIAIGRIRVARGEAKCPAVSSPDEPPYELPCGWVWTTLPELGELGRGKSRHRPRNDPMLYLGGSVPLIQTGDVARATGVVTTYSALYNAHGLEQSRLWRKGTLCITIAANIADSAILGLDACFPDSVVGFVPADPSMDVKYFEYFIRTAKAHLQDFAPSTAQKNINLEVLGNLLVPMPPTDELNRIVAKVTELLALCAQLKARIAAARDKHAQLAEALVAQAVAG